MGVSYSNGLMLLLLFLASPSLSNILTANYRQGIVESILKYGLMSDCSGTVIIKDSELDEDSYQLYSEFLLQFKRPITLLESHKGLLINLNHFTLQAESVCSDAIVFQRNHSPVQELTSLYEELRIRYYLNKVLIIVSNLGTNESASDEFLTQLRNENVYLIVQKKKWTVSGRLVGLDDDNNRLINRHLLVGTLHFPPAVLIQPSNQSISGIEPSLMAIIAKALNFTYDYVPAHPGEMWGELITNTHNKTGNGLYYGTGLWGMLMKRQVDIGVGDLYFHSLWQPHVSCSAIYKIDYDGFLVPAPQPYARWTAIVYPLSLPVWIATLISLILIVTGLHLTAVRRRQSVDSIVYTLLGQFISVQQPDRISHHRSASFILLSLWLLGVATVIPTVYRSQMISYMTSPVSTKPIDTIQQLAAYTRLGKIIYADYYKKVLLNSTDPHRRLLGHQLVTTHNQTYMYSLLDSGHWAVDSSLDTLRYYASNQHSNVHLMTEPLFPTRSCFGLQKDSPLKSHLDRVIQRLIESGLIDYQRSQFARRIQPKTGTDINNIAFTLQHLQGAFYLLTIGLSVSTVALIVELIIYRLKGRPRLKYRFRRGPPTVK